MKEFKSQKIKSVLKSLLKKKGLTYEELAEQMECSVPTVARFLGPEELTLNRLLELCEIVEIDLAELAALTEDTEVSEEKFTEAQELFLSKNKNYFAYLMQLFSGKTPKQIAEKYGLTQRSTDKYLLNLEKQELIHVTGKQKVKPSFKDVPHFGAGPLAEVYFEAFIKNSAKFFVDHVTMEISKKRLGTDDKLPAHYGVQVAKVSKASYQAWVQEQEKAQRNFEKLTSFEEKTKDPSELMTAVIIGAHTLVNNDYKGLNLFEHSMGEVTNL